jgi:hypothetical protein
MAVGQMKTPAERMRSINGRSQRNRKGNKVKNKRRGSANIQTQLMEESVHLGSLSVYPSAYLCAYFYQ